MHQIELLIHSFLQEVQKGEFKVPPPLLERFGRETQEALVKQLERGKDKFTLRGSNIGRPLCTLLNEQAGIKGIKVGTDVLRNLFGDIVEDILLVTLYSAGVPIIEEQTQVEVSLAGIKVRGALDVVIDFGVPEVWDLKSCSDWAFKNKFNKSFEEMLTDDYFGYVDQLFFYSIGRKVRVGGWIVQNKSSGEIRVIEAPRDQRLLQEQALKRMEAKALVLSPTYQRYGNLQLRSNDQHGTDVSFSNKYKFDPVDEYFRKRRTGNLVAHDACSLCEYKLHCWPDIQLKPKAKSTSKSPPLVWYIRYNEDPN